MIENLLRESNGLNSDSNSILDTYSIKDLLDLYMSYSNSKFFREHTNMERILQYISSYILKNIDKISFLELMDFYTTLLMKIIDLEGQIESNDNLIRIRSENLQSDFFRENEPKSRGDMFLKKYESELEQFKNDRIIYQTMFELLDKFQKEILTQMNLYIEHLSMDDRNLLLVEITRRIEINSLEIINRLELRNNRKQIEIQSKFHDKSIEQIYKELDVRYLEEQNYVYMNFQSVLKTIDKSNNK